MTYQPESGKSVEPSVWDHFVSKLKFWTEGQPDQEKPQTSEPSGGAKTFPWLTVIAITLALTAQLTLESSPGRTPWPGIVLYAVSLGFLITATIWREWQLPDLKPEGAAPLKTSFRLEWLLIGVFLGLFAFLLFGNGTFGFLNLFVWTLSLIFIFLAFWDQKKHWHFKLRTFWKRLGDDNWRFWVNRWTLIVLAVIAVILFFNFHQLDTVPPEMVSDQAEKLLDINDILNGHTPVYFPRNTGREAIHFYLTAAYMKLFNLDVSFLNLKVVAVFANLLTLFFIYLLGKEIGDKWVGLFAAVFAGIAYWPLLFTRLALRIPYYPLFVAPVMLFMIRGLRRRNINDVLWAGFFLGLGLHGYTPFRIMPILVVFGMILYMLNKHDTKRRLESVFALSLITIISLVVFIPLLRYWMANPDLFAYRAFSRLTGMEVGFQNSRL